MNRRQLLRITPISILAAQIPGVLTASKAKRLLFVHGRGQGGQSPSILKSYWVEALTRGAKAAQMSVPANVEISFPYYGDTLDRFTRDSQIPLVSQVTSRGSNVDEFLAFQAEFAEAVRVRAGVTDAQVDAEYGTNPQARGPLNWAWVQAILRAIDKNGGGMGQTTLETFTRDVFLYCTRAGVRDEIDRIVSAALTDEPTVVVAHSLGTIVAYSVLLRDTRQLRIPAFITVGSPLGIRSVRDQFRPLRYPPVEGWYNGFDPRDVVALYPLDAANFPVQPAIENNGTVSNHTDNRHGIDGYLDDVNVAKQVLRALT
jgi:hypothetical protein